jgi:hypothetical protein
MFPHVNGPQNVTDSSVDISLMVFAIRVVVKEAKAIVDELFQLIEILIRWWIFIRTVVKNTPTSIARRPSMAG